jgi:hypothetical protein
MQTQKSLGPTADLGRSSFDAGQGGMLVLLQDLLLSDITFWIAFSVSRVSHLKEEDYAAFPIFFKLLRRSLKVRL